VGVLVAVSIPIFTAQLEKAREATDQANWRAAKAAVVTEILNGTTSGTKYYDAQKGILVGDATGLQYGQGTTAEGNSGTATEGYAWNLDNRNAYIQATFNAKGAKMKWSSTGAPEVQIGEDGSTTPAQP
jgi:hypothetical protein